MPFHWYSTFLNLTLLQSHHTAKSCHVKTFLFKLFLVLLVKLSHVQIYQENINVFISYWLKKCNQRRNLQKPPNSGGGWALISSVSAPQKLPRSHDSVFPPGLLQKQLSWTSARNIAGWSYLLLKFALGCLSEELGSLLVCGMLLCVTVPFLKCSELLIPSAAILLCASSSSVPAQLQIDEIKDNKI